MTDERIEELCDEFDRLIELHGEYEEVVDLNDGETRECWERIMRLVDRLSPRVAKLRVSDGSDKQLVDDVEMKIESLDEAYGELAELM